MPSVHMRVRRRQSDAKWRASVASCYNTLKQIIPNCEKLPKRKISKALILKETERHIQMLENRFSDILEFKAPSKGKMVCVSTTAGDLKLASLDDIREEFSRQQQSLYQQNSSQRKKSFNIPSEVEVGLIGMRGSSCNLNVLPQDNMVTLSHWPQLHQPKDSELDFKDCEESISSEFEACMKTPNKAGRKRRNNDNKTCNRNLREDLQLGSLLFDSESPTCSSFSATQTQVMTPVSSPSCVSVTPARIFRERLSSVTSTGFTPVKLPEENELSPQTVPCFPPLLHSIDGEFAMVPQVPVTDLHDNLLCDESIDQIDMEDSFVPQLVTPKKERVPKVRGDKEKNKFRPKANGTKRKERKCKKQLEKLFPADDENKKAPPIITGVFENTDVDSCLDFDGYFLFYKSLAENEHKSPTEMANEATQLWNQMSSETKDTFVTMAAVESQGNSSSSDLSEDLADLDIESLLSESSKSSSPIPDVVLQQEAAWHGVTVDYDLSDMHPWSTQEVPCSSLHLYTFTDDHTDTIEPLDNTDSGAFDWSHQVLL